MKKNLTRYERLRASKDFEALFACPIRVEADGIRLVYKRNERGINRIAVSVGRGCGGAVPRNREKRLTREAYREIKSEITIKGGDFLFCIGRFGQSFLERRETLRTLFMKAGLYDRAG
jgi:ribonuclease P protein component